MSGLTKDQLKNELITHGVELPSSTARKGEYVRLYEKYVAPVEEAKGDFSSDDDEPFVSKGMKVNMEQSLIIDGLDISKLDDDDLFSRLSELGATVGPIVDSTRKVYQKKLLVLMGGDVVDSPTYNGDVDEEEEYSDGEAEEVIVEETNRVERTQSQTSPLIETSSIRKRVLLSSGNESAADDGFFDPDRHTPSPRRALSSVKSTTSTHETIITRRVNNGRSEMGNATASMTSFEEEEEQDRKSKISLIVRLLVKLLFLGLIIALILYIYQNNPNESPFKSVEQIVRQALDVTVGEESGAEGKGTIESPDDPPVPPPPPQEEVAAH